MFFGKRSGTPNHPAGNARGGRLQPRNYSFQLPIPPVSRSIYQFMRRQMGLAQDDDEVLNTRHGPRLAGRKRAAHRTAQSEQAKREAQIQNQVQPFQLKLEELQVQKQEGIAQIKRIRQEEMETAAKQINEKFKRDYDAKYQERQAQFQKEVQETKDEFDREQQEKTKDEPPAKLAKLETAEHDESEANTFIQRKSEGVAPSEPEAATIATDPSKKAKEHELEALNKELEQLGDTKKEMIWLLKQVIKAEQKQKDDAATSEGTK